jgi:hypothetical protein
MLKGHNAVFVETEVEQEQMERRFSQAYAIALMEEERRRRVQILADMQQRDDNERALRREWAISVMEEEHRSIMRDMFVNNISSTDWFRAMVDPVVNDFEIVCPNHIVGCHVICHRNNLEVSFSAVCTRSHFAIVQSASSIWCLLLFLGDRPSSHVLLRTTLSAYKLGSPQDLSIRARGGARRWHGSGPHDR